MLAVAALILSTACSDSPTGLQRDLTASVQTEQLSYVLRVFDEGVTATVALTFQNRTEGDWMLENCEGPEFSSENIAGPSKLSITVARGDPLIEEGKIGVWRRTGEDYLTSENKRYIAVAPADGTSTELVTEGTVPLYWTPEGNLLFTRSFGAGTDTFRSELWYLDMSSRQEMNLSAVTAPEGALEDVTMGFCF